MKAFEHNIISLNKKHTPCPDVCIQSQQANQNALNPSLHLTPLHLESPGYYTHTLFINILFSTRLRTQKSKGSHTPHQIFLSQIRFCYRQFAAFDDIPILNQLDDTVRTHLGMIMWEILWSYCNWSFRSPLFYHHSSSKHGSNSMFSESEQNELFFYKQYNITGLHRPKAGTEIA